MNKVGISRKFGEFSWLFFMLIFSVVGLRVYMLVAFFFLGDFNSIGEFIRKIEVNDMRVVHKTLFLFNSAIRNNWEVRWHIYLGKNYA